MTEDILERTLVQMAARVEFPPTPAIAQAVTTRLEARKTRPRAAGLALWSRRRVVVALVLAALLLASAAVAAGIEIGAIRIEVGPSGPPAPPAAVEPGAT